MCIRKMEIADLDTVCMIENQLFGDSWKKDDFIYELESNPFGQYYVIIDKEVVGFIGLWILDNQCQITNIAIEKSNQGKGLGNKLMEYAFKEAKNQQCLNINLEVRVSNTPAIELYKKFGLKQVAIRKRYYKDGEDAYLMIKEMEE